MRKIFQNYVISVVIFMLALASSSLASDRDKFLETQDDVNKLVAHTAKEFLLERSRYNWKLSPTSDCKELSIGSKYWKLIKMQIKMGEGLYKGYPTLVYQSSLDETPLSIGLRDLRDNPAVLDCTLANAICRIVCLQALMGDYFDGYAKSVFKDLVHRDESNRERFIFILPHGLSEKIQKCSEIPIGSLITYINIPEYTSIHPKGMTQAENLFCVEKGKYLGFGDHFTNPKTFDEITDDFYKALIVESPECQNKEVQLRYKNDKERFIKEIKKINGNLSVGLFDLNKIKSAQTVLKCSVVVDG